MGKGTDRMVSSLKKQADAFSKHFAAHYGDQCLAILDIPIKIILSPFTIPLDIAAAAPRGYGIPEFASRISFSAIFVVATLGTWDVALELGKKVLCSRECRTCNGWQAMRCTMCKGTGTVKYRVGNCSLRSGERATAECVAEAIVENRAELVHVPSSANVSVPLPSKDCPSCDGSGVMNCPACKNKLQIRISADDIMEPPWKAYNVMRKMEYPYENIAHSMRDPKIAAFWLFTMPQVMGGFEYDDDVKQKIWWAYKDSMRYDQLRDVVAKRKPGWEDLQNALVSLDPARARDDPAIVKNVPFYKAKKALEEQVLKLDAPPRPQNWGELDLPLSASSWNEEELRDPKKLLEMTALLSAQKEMADRILDAQWEAKWRQDKLNGILEEKLQPYIRNINKDVLPQSIIVQSNDQESKKNTRRRWWFF